MADDIHIDTAAQLQAARGVIVVLLGRAQRWEAENGQLRAVLDAIAALHQPYSLGDGRTSEDCDECGDRWPCPTARLLHPMTLDEAIDTLGTVHK